MIAPRKYKMKMNQKVKWLTFIALALVIGGFSFLYFTSGGSYLPAWFTVLILALFLLAALSIPRYVSITQTSIEVHCLMEITVIPIGDIKRIETISKNDMKWALPIPFLGIWGVFGYYGYYFDLKNLKTFKLYASQWNDFILIENIYEEIIIVCCEEPEELIQQVKGLNF